MGVDGYEDQRFSGLAPIFAEAHGMDRGPREQGVYWALHAGQQRHHVVALF